MNDAENSSNITEEVKQRQMRKVALEFASSMYRNNDGNMGDNTATGFLAFAEEVYKYIKEGKTNA